MAHERCRRVECTGSFATRHFWGHILSTASDLSSLSLQNPITHVPILFPSPSISRSAKPSSRPAMPGEKAPSSSDEEESAVYSVWAMPSDHVRERLVKLMGNLRSEFGGPEFEPHVTVVGAIRLTKEDALHKLQSSCSGLKPYPARINTVSKGSFFYQCVYLLLDPTPEVVEASARCSSHFGYESSTPYMPHLSLLYGDLTDEEKGRAVERVKIHDQDICNLSFEVSRLALYKTDTEDKTLKSWEKVADWNLLGGNW